MFILLGYPPPIILGCFKGHYTSLAEAYLDGHMTGGNIEELEQGMHILEDFELL